MDEKDIVYIGMKANVKADIWGTVEEQEDGTVEGEK